MRELQKHIPMNDFGLPIGFYRADLLPFHDYEAPRSAEEARLPHIQSEDLDTLESQDEALTADEWITSNGSSYNLSVPEDQFVIETDPETSTESSGSSESSGSQELQTRRVAGFPATQLEQAFIWLSYDEGYPTLPNGQPFWNRLEYEDTESFGLFQRYLLMTKGTNPDPNDPKDDTWKPAEGVRSLTELATQLYTRDSDIVVAVEKFQVINQLYYWGLRSKAYDLFKVVQYRKQQEQRAIETQDSHYFTSRRLLHRLMGYMEDEEEFWDMMTPKTGIDMLKTLTQLERVSAGLPAAGPLTEKQSDSGNNRGTPFELILRKAALEQHEQMKLVNGNQEGSLNDEESDILDKALSDPETFAGLQELIIRVGGG